MKQVLTFLLASLAASGVLAGCDSDSSTESTTTGTGGTAGSGASGGAGGATGGQGGTGAAGGTGGTGGAADVCGDGVLASGEACDDGNTDAGDGCDATCGVEAGYTCAGEPSDCLTACGDGVVAGAEECDDGNTDALDGCDDACVVEPGYACDGAPSTCVTACGDGIVAGAEACDDGNTDALDGCDAACLVEKGYTCDGEPSACVLTCGDGILGGAEGCDDGNTDAGDGCDDACLVETGYTCAGEPSACATTCGDGVIAGDEACDDGNAGAQDGCSDQCEIEAGYVCLAEPSLCAPVCGDGLVRLPEGCDDGNTGAMDGCDAACAVEAGWTCTGLPSACVTTCGDGIVAGTEACDDGGTAANDGCSPGCAIDPGYYCSGAPSACVTQCGDGIVAGTEACDDGNQVDGDGCNSQCTPNSGETCAEPLLPVQATQVGGQYVWTVAAGGVVSGDGDWGCDPNGVGPDVVVKYTKTSDTLANGGQLLHVKADTPLSSTTSNYLDLEIKGGSCDQGAGASVKCDWYKDNWDSYLDVPPGDYWIFVAKNSTGTFPQVTILAEEVPASAAEGEGCFAPYTTSSANYTPPGGAGQPHTWTIADGAINSFDMSATWGEPGSISCDDHATYGDITGVDAVIEYNKASPTSVLKIDVQNLDPVLSQSDLDLEVLNVCDSNSPSKVSRHCRAQKDTLSITAPSPAGPVYLWLAADATGQELQGATVQVTEIFPGPGESWPTAQPLPGSGPIAATSAQRLDAPSCFPAGVNVHWFSYTLANDVFSFSANAAGVVGVYDAGGQERACVGDAMTAPLSFFGQPGETYYVAVQSPSPITAVTIQDVVYDGIQGAATDMMVTFPSSATGEYAMAADAGQLYMADSTKVFAFPKTVGAVATEYGSAVGITTTNLGYDIELAGGSLFGVDSTTSTSASRLFRLFDGVTWGPSAWDVTPTYPASAPTYALATDGMMLFEATRKTTTSSDTSFYSLSPSGAGAPTLLGTTPGIWYTVGLAADSTYFYVASNGAAGEGVYRVLRSNLTAAPVKIATLDTSSLHTSIDVDAYASPQYLYVRAYNGDVHAIKDPGGPAPVHVGAINTLGTTSDYSMVYDKAGGAIYLFETETVSTGRVVKLQ